MEVEWLLQVKWFLFSKAGIYKEFQPKLIFFLSNHDFQKFKKQL